MMTTTKTPTLLCTLLSTLTLLACDPGEPDDAPGDLESTPIHGLGELDLQAELESRASSPVAPTLGVNANLGEAVEALAENIGLPSREQDAAGWVQWSGRLPYYAGPIFDETGAQCGEGQDGPIWYLPGTAGGPVNRTCTIPVGKQIVFPLLNYYGAYPVSSYPTPEDAQASIDYFEETAEWIYADLTCSLTAKLDGQDLYADLTDTWQLVIDPFEVELPDDPDNFADWYGIQGVTTDAVSAGYYARLPALAPGEHTLEFGGTLCYEGEIWFDTYASYTIQIEP
jgi:hypothetical protein